MRWCRRPVGSSDWPRRLDQLIAARRWPRKARILRSHPELLGVDALRLLDAADGDVRRLHAVLLRRAGDVGPDCAVVEIRAAVELVSQLVEDGAAALRRYRVAGADDELAVAVEAFDAAVALAVPGFPDRARRWRISGSRCAAGSRPVGAEADLRRAIDVLEEAVLISAAEPDLHARRAALVDLNVLPCDGWEAG